MGKVDAVDIACKFGEMVRGLEGFLDTLAEAEPATEPTFREYVQAEVVLTHFAAIERMYLKARAIAVRVPSNEAVKHATMAARLVMVSEKTTGRVDFVALTKQITEYHNAEATCEICKKPFRRKDLYVNDICTIVGCKPCIMATK